MTIKDLWSIINKVGKKLPVSELKSILGINTIAVDANLIIFGHFSQAWKDNMHLELEEAQRNCIEIVVRNILFMEKRHQKLGILNIFCFDGDKLESKLATAKRHADREKKASQIEVLKEHLTTDNNPHQDTDDNGNTFSQAEIKATLFTKMKNNPVLPVEYNIIVMSKLSQQGVRCIRVNQISEAEKLCSILCILNIAQAVYSNDGDLVALGTPIIIKEIKDRFAEVFLIKDIRDCLSMTQERILDLAILLGNDFNERVKNNGVVRSMKLALNPSFDIKKYEETNSNFPVNVDVCRRMLSISEEDIQIVSQSLS